MLGIRVGKDLIALTNSFPKALSYVSHLVESCNVGAIIDAYVSESLVDRREYMQCLMDDYGSRSEDDYSNHDWEVKR